MQTKHSSSSGFCTKKRARHGRKGGENIASLDSPNVSHLGLCFTRFNSLQVKVDVLENGEEQTNPTGQPDYAPIPAMEPMDQDPISWDLEQATPKTPPQAGLTETVTNSVCNGVAVTTHSSLLQ
jgi:hypothetical protein